MLYKGRAVEIGGQKEVFGQKIAWVQILEDSSFLQLSFENLEDGLDSFSMSYVRFVDLLKIKTDLKLTKFVLL